MNNILSALILFLPAGLSNMSPVLVAKLPYLRNWRAPIDGGREYRGKRLLGNNKTWRGLISGVVIATLSGFFINQLTAVEAPVWLFSLMGFGALAGDTIESFYKRQAAVPPGKSWFPFDQLDYIAGGLLLVTPFGYIDFNQAIWIVAVYFGLHLAVSYVGYLTGFKDTPI